MKFLSDENLPRSILRYLRSQGHNVKDIQEEGLRGLPDEQIVEIASREERIIITYDKDFIAFQQDIRGFSAILLRFPRVPPRDVIPYLEALLDSIIAGKIPTPFILVLTQEKVEIIK